MNSQVISSSFCGRDKNVAVDQSFELNSSKSIYKEIKRLERRKNFYMKLTILFLILNMVMILQAFSQLVTVDGVTISNSTQITIKGTILNAAGSALENSGTLDITGDFINNSGGSLFGTSEGTVILSGAAQTISGNSVTIFNNLMLLGSGIKLLQQDITVGGDTPSKTGILSLSSQVLELNSNEITVTNSTAAAVSRTTGFIVSETGPASGYGVLKWEIKNNTGNYIFPFGNSLTNSYLPVTIDVNTAGIGTNSYLSVATYPTTTTANPNNRPLPNGLTSLMNLSGSENAQNVLDRWWVIDAGNFTSKPVSDIQLTYRDSEWDASAGSTNLITESSLQAQSSDGSVWSPVPMGFVNTATNTVTITNHNMYNPMWALVVSSSPLPIELISFTAKLNSENEADLNWSTATEINNHYFTIEKSANGLQFEPLMHVDGAGNSTNVLHYHEVDEHPFNGITYYRLKQTDYDGRYTYSEIKSVRMDNSSQATFQVFPNPAKEQFYVKFNSETTLKNLFILDINGKVVKEIDSSEFISSSNGVFEIQRGTLSAGMYFVSTLEGKMEKLILQ